jgi:hypothetical protein
LLFFFFRYCGSGVLLVMMYFEYLPSAMALVLPLINNVGIFVAEYADRFCAPYDLHSIFVGEQRFDYR